MPSDSNGPKPDYLPRRFRSGGRFAWWWVSDPRRVLLSYVFTPFFGVAVGVYFCLDDELGWALLGFVIAAQGLWIVFRYGPAAFRKARQMSPFNPAPAVIGARL